MDADSIPIIDMTPWYVGTEEQRIRVAKDLAHACEKVGFFILQNTQVPKEVIDNMFDVSLRYFQLPDEVKRQCGMSDDYPYGYEASETLVASLGGVSTVPDLKETFSLCLGPKNGTPHASMPKPRWPTEPVDIVEKMTAYYQEMERLAPEIMHMFALALDVPHDFFASKYDKHISALRTLHYPAQTGEFAPRPGQIRASQHCDYGALTLLVEKGPGLQVMKKDGSWLDVVVPDGGYVVNIGDMMARWTNDKWRSTLHRVINADEAHKNQARQSAAFFVNLNPDAEVSTIASCITAENANKYDKVIAGEYLMQKHAAAMKNKRVAQ